ncbi:energy transducer TonB family protein [Spirabiliibacterium falconis]|uniref:energy transducer TonB family protein n=1 Tax=Spirabiliibacterium falconis TaxID=572023 RepID=UPI001AAD6156|nr:energy transducer TonB [Spirabiliibacterium falconis]MBE2894963.1 energy transducer TonB [Spirabiliibacterium falconis]
MKGRSLVGFAGSLLLHSAVASAVIMAIANTDDQSINGIAVQNPSDSISMEMVMAMIQAQKQPEPVVQEQTEPDPEPEEQPKEEPKEEIPDPTVLPKPVEKPKVEKKKENPKPKPKPAPKKPVKKVQEKPTKQKTQSAVSGERTVNSPNQANSSLAAGAKSSNQAVIGQGGAQIDDYRRQLRREIERNKRYSQRAKMMRQQGKVIIRFTLSPNGTITGASVAKSSGFAELDKLALQAVNAARPVGPRPAGMNSLVTVPIDFTLR